MTVKDAASGQEAPESLLRLISVPGPSGDEGGIAAYAAGILAEQSEITVHRIGDSLIALRGEPKTAVFAHTDTTGYTLGYERRLIPIGGPHPSDVDPLVSTDLAFTGRLRIVKGKDGQEIHLRRVRAADGGAKSEPVPGTRWVYARAPRVRKGVLTSPYLDNRAGVWAALEVLARVPNVAVAFCTGEEQHGHGARICADWLFRERGITQALIADITWHTDDTPCGKGVVISLRDAFSPRQAFLDKVLALSEESGIAHQREVQSAGSSDGGHILRSSVPMDWVFVGAPEKDPHTARERITLTDLFGMADLLAYLTERL